MDRSPSALQRPYTFVVVALLVLVLGVAAIVKMPKDVLPNVDIPVLSVIWTYNGLSPSDMEKRIVTPSERAFTTTVNDVEHIESQSFYGVAVIRICSSNPTANIESAQAQVEASAQAITRSLPTSITPPLIIRYSASNVSILQMSIHSDTIPEQALFDYAHQLHSHRTDHRARRTACRSLTAANPAQYHGRYRPAGTLCTRTVSLRCQ